jgi:hypothetical protein
LPEVETVSEGPLGISRIGASFGAVFDGDPCALIAAPVGKVYVNPLPELALSNVFVGLCDLSEARSTSRAAPKGASTGISDEEDGSVVLLGGSGGGAVRSWGRARWLPAFETVPDDPAIGGGTLGVTMGEASDVDV